MARQVHNRGEVKRIAEANRAAEFGVADAAPGFDSLTEISAERPALVIATATAETDGAAEGRVDLEVDRDGGGAVDDVAVIATADPDNAAGASYSGTAVMFVPPGGQYQVNNQADPNAGNAIIDVFEVSL